MAYNHPYTIHARPAVSIPVRMWRSRPRMMERLWKSHFGWLLWNPLLKWHNVAWGHSPIPSPQAYINGKLSPHLIQSIFSVCGFGFLMGFRATVDENGNRRLEIGNKSSGSGVVRGWWFGRVELRTVEK